MSSLPQESPRIDTAYKDLKTTKNLENYIQWFNRLSYMVATEVCMVSQAICIDPELLRV